MIYDLWFVISAVGLILLFVGAVDTVKYLDDVDWVDLLLFGAAFICLLLGAINAGTLDFVLPNGTLYTDQTEVWAVVPLFGLAFISMAGAVGVIILGLKNRNMLIQISDS